MYSKDRLIIFDADGTTIDAFSAIEKTFAAHDMNLGNLDRFQKRHHLFKYLGGIKEFPRNLRKQISKKKRKKLINTLTEVYREEACLYEGIAQLIKHLQTIDNVRLGVITRNITTQPVETLQRLFGRHDVDPGAFDFLIHLPLRLNKTDKFREIRSRFKVNPALAYACGDELKDYAAAVENGIHCFMVSYGFESYKRLHRKYSVPQEIISRSPKELCTRLFHTFDLDRL